MGGSVIMHALMTLMVAQTPDDLAHPPPQLSECYDVLGCFPTDGVWQGPERPVSLPPLPPALIAPTFCLHTPARPRCHVLKVDDFASLHNSMREIGNTPVFLAHGYLESTELTWVSRLVQALVGQGGVVVTVDWATAAKPPYHQAVANIRVVGAFTGHLLHVLAEYYGMPLGQVHLVGHSLGAHLMSYASQYVQRSRGEKVGRITGLDPAGPYFTGMAPEVRLDPSDAFFVDVIHTDIPTVEWQLDKLGYADPIGHVDFYPNGGVEQAGCEGSISLHIANKANVARGVLSYLGCDHQRSHLYFTESILSQCQFVGVQCDSWEAYLSGSCWGCHQGTNCFTLGLHTSPPPSAHPPHSFQDHSTLTNDKGNVVREDTDRARRTEVGREESESSVAPVMVFFGTNVDDPFCAEQYLVRVVSSGGAAAKRSGGDVARFTVGLRGHLGSHTIPAPERSTFVKPGGEVSWVGFSQPLGDLHTIRVEYEQDHGLLHSLIWRFSPPKLYVEAIYVHELSTGSITRFPFCEEQMEAGQSYTLYPYSEC